MTAAVSHSKPVLFFGVNSEGMGHATRSLPLLEGLAAFYNVHVFCGGRAYDFLSRKLEHVHRVAHLQFVYENNRFLLGATVRRAMREFLPHAFDSVADLALRILRQRPVAIVTDYEPLTAYAALFTGRKIISIDNQHLVTYGQLPDPMDEATRGARRVMRNSNFWNHPLRHRVLISSFFQPPLRAGAAARGVRYVPTTLRPGVRARLGRTRNDGPVLVYQTSHSNFDLLATLEAARRSTGLRFAVYGAGKPDGPAPEGIVLRRFCEEQFLDDMAAAPFVIVNGGHSTINEALSLHKPVLAEPIADQYEQAANVIGLEQMGVGRGTGKLSVEDIASSHAELPRLANAAALVRPANNDAVLEAVMQALWEVNPRRAVEPLALRAPFQNLTQKSPSAHFSRRSVGHARIPNELKKSPSMRNAE
ncbi:MAG TPA: glycosyltransferase family protein [Myxococcaceae bacterium]|nr:glycosyltransferase family protein [Myxococcaceae bacterium]